MQALAIGDAIERMEQQREHGPKVIAGYLDANGTVRAGKPSESRHRARATDHPDVIRRRIERAEAKRRRKAATTQRPRA
jgi:hypothetical protein